MREGVAVSKPPADDDEPSNVIPFPKRSVDYTGSALRMMAGLTKAVNDLRNALDDREKQRIRKEIQKMIERIIETMEIIQEHMDVLEENSELIQEFLDHGDDAYFLSDATSISMRVISLIERRNATLMVRRLFFKGARLDLPTLENDNDRQTLLAHEGAICCKWPRTP